MAKEYLDKLTDLMERTMSSRSKQIRLEYKHFFSGAAVYANGRICITLTPVGLALKLPESLRNDLTKEEGTKALQYFPDAPIKKDYIVLPDRLVNDRESLQLWAEKSIDYVVTLSEPGQTKNK